MQKGRRTGRINSTSVVVTPKTNIDDFKRPPATVPEEEEEEDDSILDQGYKKAEEIYDQIVEWIWGRNPVPASINEGARIRARRASVVAASSGAVLPNIQELKSKLGWRCCLAGCECDGFCVNPDPMFFHLCGDCGHETKEHVVRGPNVDFALYINGEQRDVNALGINLDEEDSSDDEGGIKPHHHRSQFSGLRDGGDSDDEGNAPGGYFSNGREERERKWGLPRKYDHQFKELMKQGHSSERCGDFHDGLSYYQQAEEVAKRMGTEWLEVGVAINAQGNALRRLGELENAEKHYNLALKIHENCIGEDEPATCSVKNNLAAIYVQTGREMQGLELYEEVLEILQEVVEADSPLLMVTLNNIGHLKKNQGKLEESLEYYERALKIQSSVKNPSAEQTRVLAVAHQNLAQLYSKLTDLDSARDHYDSSALQWRKLPGWGEAHLALVLTASAHIAVHKGLHLRAIRMFKEAKEKLLIAKQIPNLKTDMLRQVTREIEELEVILALNGKNVPVSSSSSSSAAAAAAKPKPKPARTTNPFLAKLLEASRNGQLEKIVDAMPADL